MYEAEHEVWGEVIGVFGARRKPMIGGVKGEDEEADGGGVVREFRESVADGGGIVRGGDDGDLVTSGF